jgi:uroporphyrin-3 C-methyltransferase
VSEKFDDKDSKDKAVTAASSSSGKKSTKGSASWDPSTAPPPNPGPLSAAVPSGKGGSSIAGWFALLLVLGLGLAAAWSAREAMNRESALDRRLTQLESVENNQQDILAKLDQGLQERLQTGLAIVEAVALEQASQLARLESSLESQSEEIARFGTTDRNDWLLAEAEYLLRLANQRLIMSGDIAAATALLKSADSILRELEDVSFYQARAAVATDLVALRAVPKVDVEGLYLRLAALIGEVERLKVFELPDRQSSIETTPAESWTERFAQGYRAALQKLSNYIVIDRKDVPYEALMDPQWEGLVRQNMRMLLEQAQVALLSGNQVLFRESLERAGHWVGQFFEVDETGSQAIARDISALVDTTIAVEAPNVSRSLRELNNAVEQRLQLEEGI